MVIVGILGTYLFGFEFSTWHGVLFLGYMTRVIPEKSMVLFLLWGEYNLSLYAPIDYCFSSYFVSICSLWCKCVNDGDCACAVPMCI